MCRYIYSNCSTILQEEILDKRGDNSEPDYSDSDDPDVKMDSQSSSDDYGSSGVESDDIDTPDEEGKSSKYSKKKHTVISIYM